MTGDGKELRMFIAIDILSGVAAMERDVSVLRMMRVVILDIIDTANRVRWFGIVTGIVLQSSTQGISEIDVTMGT